MKKLFIMFMALSLSLTICSCGAKQSEINANNRTTVTESPERASSIDFEVDDGKIKYVGFEKADPELTTQENVILLKFEYSNKQSSPSTYQSTFGIQCFQNSVEITNSSISYSSKAKEQYELCSNAMASVMTGGTLVFGKLVQVKDNSPLTVIVSERKSSNKNTQSMEIDLSADADNSGEPASDTAQNTQAPAQTQDLVQPINIGDVIKTDDFEFTLNNVDFTQEVLPPDTSGYYRSYEAEAGKVYLHIKGSYYNKSKKDICIRDLFIPTADYNNGYTYKGFVVVDDGNSFTWASSYIVCNPLSTCIYNGIIECPAEVQDSQSPLNVTFTAGGTKYKYTIR